MDIRAGGFEFLGDMPGDGLALPIRVRREVDVLPPLGGLLEPRDDFGFPLDDLVLRGEIVLDIHTEGALGQILHVADRGFDRETPAEVLLDGAGLRGRLHDNQRSGAGAAGSSPSARSRPFG